MAAAEPIALNSADLRLLTGLRLAPRRIFSGRVRGERISRARGISVEFADYRDYSDGDDLRHLDWNVLARLERPVIRTYQDENDLAVYLALDTSASMDFGSPSKFEHASKIALALGYIGLLSQDGVYAVALGNREPRPSRVLRGRAGYTPLSEWFRAQKPEGSSGLAIALTRFARLPVRAGMFVCVTDALDPAAADAFRAVASRGHELCVIQTLSELDLNPEIEGDLRLLDSETGAPLDLTATVSAIAQYQKNLQEHCHQVENAVLRVGGRYLRTGTDVSLADIIQRGLRRLGVVETR